MMLKKCAVAAAALAMSGALVLPVSATAAQSSAPSASQPSSSAASDSQAHPKHHGGFDHMAWVLLADLTGQSTQELMQRYPQQTPWQAAKQAGKLDGLKKAFLERAAQRIHTLQAEGKLSAKDATALYDSLAQRVAKIDGEKTVTLGPAHAGNEQSKS